MARPKLITNTSVFAKLCTGCPEKGLQLRSAFYKDAQKRDGLSSQCKACVNARVLLYRGTPAQKASAHRWATSAKCRAKRPGYEARRSREARKATGRASEARRRARKRGLPATHSPRDERFLRAYWQDACAVCGERAGLWKLIVLATGFRWHRLSALGRFQGIWCRCVMRGRASMVRSRIVM